MAHRFEDHTSEVRLAIEAPSLPALLAEAGAALAELMVGSWDDVALGPPEPVVVDAPDAAALLVNWLNELIFRSEVTKQVYAAFDIERASARELRGTIRGFEPAALKTWVKAATLHGAEVREEDGCFRASVVLDV